MEEKIVLNSFEEAARLVIAQTIKDHILAHSSVNVDTLAKDILNNLETEFSFSIDDTKVKYEYACYGNFGSMEDDDYEETESLTVNVNDECPEGCDDDCSNC